MCDYCHKCELMNVSPNGTLFFNKAHRLVLVEYKNFCFDFYEKEYLSFVTYICGLDGETIEKEHQRSLHRRKIPINLGHDSLTLMLNREELEELKFLFTGVPKPFLLQNPVAQIDYKVIYN